MNIGSLLKLSYFGLTTILFRRHDPLIGSLILTDRCNLSCRHCAVSNTDGAVYSYSTVMEDMKTLYSQGVRILFFYGGEPFLWEDGVRRLRDLVIEAKTMGFDLVNVVTNGTFPLNLPEADLIMVSLDGTRSHHNLIRGDTYDRIMENIRQAPSDNLCLYMAINSINREDIEAICETARTTPHVRAVSFNLHTPYPGTEGLKLGREETLDACRRIRACIAKGEPVLNLRSALPYMAEHRFKTPCRQCIVMENGKQWICGRCIDIEGLCGECGFLFAAEFSLLFGGNPRVILDFIKTYGKYLIGDGYAKKRGAS
jgi:MoaA/NifB/PqqE/SkfB family radical SAM enzyme